MNSKLIITGGIMAGILLGGGMYIHSGSSNDVETVAIHASWSKGYNSFDELIVDSDLIAFVTVGEVVKEWSVGETPKKDVELTITKPIYNGEIGQKIIVAQTGEKQRKHLNSGVCASFAFIKFQEKSKRKNAR